MVSSCSLLITELKTDSLMCFCYCLVGKSCLTLLRPHVLQSTRILCPQSFPGMNTEVGCHFLLRGSSPPRNQTFICLTDGFFATEPRGKPPIRCFSIIQVNGRINRKLQIEMEGWMNGVNEKEKEYRYFHNTYNFVFCRLFIFPCKTSVGS